MLDTINMLDNARMSASSASDGKLKQIERKLSFDNMLADKINDNAEKNTDPEKSVSWKKPVDKKLMAACQDMESIFIAKMLKEMRATVPKNEWLGGGFAEEIFKDMLYDEYSKSMSKTSSFGISNMLYKELSRKL
jgi:flagellar protein FlgJ